MRHVKPLAPSFVFFLLPEVTWCLKKKENGIKFHQSVEEGVVYFIKDNFINSPKYSK